MFFEVIFLLQKCGKWAKNELKIRIFEFVGKFSHYFFQNLVYNESLYCLLYSYLLYIWEQSGSWDMYQNTLEQSDCKIFKSTISLEQNIEKVWLFACWYQIMKIKSWLTNIEMGLVKNMCGHYGHRTLKLAVSQEVNNGINWFSLCLYKFRKAKSYFNSFWVVVVKNGHDLLDHETLKSVVSQKWIAVMSWFFACWYKFRKVKSYFNNYWEGIVENGRDL